MQRPPAQRGLILAGLMTPAALLLAGCGSGVALMSNVVLSADGSDGLAASGRLDVTAVQRAYLDSLTAAGIQSSSELRALSIGSYVCQARAAGRSERAVWDYVAPMVRSDVADGQAAAAIAGYIRLASQLLC